MVKPTNSDQVEVLETMFLRGMKGWGQAHLIEIEAAKSATGLADQQIKVG